MTLSDGLLLIVIVEVAVVGYLSYRLPVTWPKPPAGQFSGVPDPDPGLSLHCGHTHHEFITAGDGLTYCPVCAPRAVKKYGLAPVTPA